MSIENPDFLKQKYNLHTASEVESASSRTNIRAEHPADPETAPEAIGQNPKERIQNYLDRFQEILDRPDEAKRERGLEALKEVLHRKFVIKDEEIPQSYFDNQRRLARDQGHGEIEITDEMREQLTEVIITDQTSSLDTWTDYLSSQDATYPNWLKYYAFRGMLSLSSYDKEKHEFGKRDKGTVAPFPDLNREALAYVLDILEKKYDKKLDLTNLADTQRQDLEKLLQGENFGKLYAYAIEKVTPATQESLEKAEGVWVKYDKGSDHLPLVKSLQGHGTGWCTAGESTAQTQLQAGDFYVYYSYDAEGQPIVPRAAIRMQEGKIGEVRGVAKEQNLDPYIAPVVETKLKEFPDGASYAKKSHDMKLLTQLEEKTKKQEALTKGDLSFLYEIASTIEGFGYQRDPRIAELRSSRNSKEDMSIVFDCTPDQIAHTADEVTDDTKAYVGPWSMEVFQTIRNYPNIAHLYESFPDQKIWLQTLETDPAIINAESAEAALTSHNIFLSGYAKDLVKKTEFSQKSATYHLVQFTAAQLGLKNVSTTDEIYTKAQQLGLELCPAEVGPHLRLQYKGNDWKSIAMKPISGRGGDLDVFDLDVDEAGLLLNTSYASPGRRWGNGCHLVFWFRPAAEFRTGKPSSVGQG